jgi:hypothetical protein
MIPYLLALAGGYLIGSSMKETYESGGVMKDGGVDDFIDVAIPVEEELNFNALLKKEDVWNIEFLKEVDAHGKDYNMYRVYYDTKKELKAIKSVTSELDGWVRFAYADGGEMAKGGRITKGSKYITNFRTSDGDSGYSIIEIVDTDYFSNKYGGSPHTIRHKVIESSHEEVGKYDENSRETIQNLLKNGLWTKLDNYADGGEMAIKDSVMVGKTIKVKLPNEVKPFTDKVYEEYSDFVVGKKGIWSKKYIVKKTQHRGVMENGGKIKWQDVNVGDSARVVAENKMGLIFSTYGRKFNLRFPDGKEKTYDATELEFYKDDED